MHLRRPLCVRQEIEQKFSKTQAIKPVYRVNGGASGYTLLNAVSTGELVHVLRRDRPVVNALEVGTGNGGFLLAHNWGEGAEVHGVTAVDYRTDGMPDRGYFIANAEYLDRIPELRSDYDLVVTQLTLLHLVDKLAALEAMANRVAPGGFLYVDGAGVAQANDVVAADVLGALQQAGFRTFVWHKRLESSAIPLMLAQRVGEPRPVNLGVDYVINHADDTWDYKNIQFKRHHMGDVHIHTEVRQALGL